jgi:N,N'-diacetyllegionaminate synthase
LRTLIIAEAGINHNRDMNMAVKLIEAAREAGADVVKFQLEVGGDYCPTFEQMKHLYLYCMTRDVKFACTAFDCDSLEFLFENTKMEFVKIASKCFNKKLLAMAGKSNLPVILSTGASELNDIRANIEDIIGQRYLEQNINISLLHCVSAYPAPMQAVNLKAMDLMRRHFMIPVGLSDHTLGTEVAIAAVARGAGIVEKHLTLDRSLPGPDHICSLQPSQFKGMVEAIRNVEIALGEEVKTIQRCER